MATKKKAVKKRSATTVEKVLRDQLLEMEGLRNSWAQRYQDEVVARTCSEQQCSILSEQMKDYTRLAEEVGGVGDLLRTQYPDEIQKGDHGGSQTLAQVLWRYLKVERRYGKLIQNMNADELITVGVDADGEVVKFAYRNEVKAMQRKPWLAGLVRWFA